MSGTKAAVAKVAGQVRRRRSGGSPVDSYLGRLSPGSRETMGGALRWLARLLGQDDPQKVPWHEIDYGIAGALRERLVETYSPATARKMLSVLRGVLKQSWRHGLMSDEAYRTATDLDPIRGETLPPGRALSSGEIASLIEGCEGDRSPAGVRDAAVLATSYICGIRAAEIVNLDLGDYDRESCALKVAGKGSKERLVYATNGARDHLEAWLEIRGEEPGAVFCPIHRSGAIRQGERMTRGSLNQMLNKRARAAGVARFSPHDLRRTCISDLLDRGADLVTVQHLAGHANPATTARYDRRGEEAKRRTADLLTVPFHGRKGKP